MNKENAHLYLPLVQALAEGKTIQWKSDEGFWDDIHEIVFCMYDAPEYFRIKPEPRTWSFWIDPEGDLHPYNTTPFTDWKRIEVQEVLE